MIGESTSDWADHINLRNTYLANAREMLDRGEIAKAGELLWGAVSQAILALGAIRELTLNKHRLMREFMRQISKERKDSYYSKAFSRSEELHANFYWNFIEPEDMPERYEATEELLRRLEEELRVLIPNEGKLAP